ncbi:MFS transporter [Streptomyces spiralis]|uniref:MFS transporter n=1 Tax=Streptomyces spiralis TaxID=66376 RepID=A0A918ZW38_9ACTN|nr:MFS transporter [Streptomyces spiralis]GHE73357.1 MFS transporter [Streptomyces spiralis]
MSDHPDTSTRLPFVVILLALGTFLMGTTELVIAGILPEIASDLGVGVSQAGLLITSFAIGMIVGSPTMAIATLRLPRRSTLVLALLVFAAGHAIAALSSSYTVVFVARALTALATGTFWAVASVVAAAAAPPAARSRALGVMMSGASLATVVGVPLGSWAGQSIGWRGTFWALAALAALAAVAIGRFVPAEEQRPTVSVRSEIAALGQGRLWLSMAVTALITGGAMAAFTYITPLLTDRAGIAASAVPLVLAGYGIGALVGANAGGRFGGHKPLTTIATAATTGTVVLLLLQTPLSHNPVTTIILVVLLGVVAMSVPPVVTALSVRFAGNAPTLAVAVTVSAFNAGIAAGSSIAASALDSSLGLTGPALVGTIMVALAGIPLSALAAIRATRTDTPEPAQSGADEADEKASETV